MQCVIDDLPDEILEYILSLISPYKDLQNCKCVSKRWYQISRNVIEHRDAYFKKSVAYGYLFWNFFSKNDSTPTIGKRHSHSACIYESYMYVFGGCTAACTTFNDLWRLDLATKQWIRPLTMGNYPSPKACATMLCYKKSFILFGGWSYPSPYPLHQQWKLYNELHIYSIEANRWVAINTVETPPPTSAHSASIHKNLMIIFGGVADGYSTNAVWCLNLDTYCWKKQLTSRTMPQPRYGQSQIRLDDKHLLILGGCTGPNVAMNDAWVLTMEDPVWSWSKVKMENEKYAPTRIWCHQACRVGDNVIVLSKRKTSTNNGMSISAKKLGSPVVNSCFFQKSDRSVQKIDRDENVNGRRGYLQKPMFRLTNYTTMNSPTTSSVSSYKKLHISNSRNFKQQIDQKIHENQISMKLSKNSDNTLAIYVLDIRNILLNKFSASWTPFKLNNQPSPDERILYSLVLGKGELIIFGGMRKEQTTLRGQPEINDSQVYNDLFFINSPKNII